MLEIHSYPSCISQTNVDLSDAADHHRSSAKNISNNGGGQSREALKTIKNKRVLFKEDVNVRKFDDEGNVFRSEHQSLKVTSRVCPRIGYDPARSSRSDEKLDWYVGDISDCSGFENDVVRSILFGPSSGGDEDRPSEDVRPRPPSRQTVTSVEPEPTVEFHIVRHKLRGDLLLFCVALGPGYDLKCVMVRANSSGKKIGVTACSRKPTAFSAKTNAPVKLEYRRRFSLPCVVDSGRVQARVDTEGNLRVEAAILSSG